jgi:hypothetical protein
MDLFRAIQAVLKICPREQHYYRSVRFMPGPAGQPDRICATDGVCTFMAHVPSQELPNALLSADLLKRALSGGAASLSLAASPFGWVTGKVGSCTYQFPGVDFANYPGIPEMPPTSGQIYAEDIARVLPAAEKAGGELDLIHFSAGFLEATDRAQLIRLEHPMPFDLVVPARLFAGWKQGVIEVSRNEHVAFFSHESELRYATIQRNAFPHTEDIPDEHEGPWVLLPSAMLHAAVKRGEVVSKSHVIELRIDQDKVVIRALVEDRSQGDKVFLAEVPVLHGVPENEVVVLSGKILAKILSKVDTPNVKLGYGGPLRPIRLESGSWFALLWQMTY